MLIFIDKISEEHQEIINAIIKKEKVIEKQAIQIDKLLDINEKLNNIIIGLNEKIEKEKG